MTEAIDSLLREGVGANTFGGLTGGIQATKGGLLRH